MSAPGDCPSADTLRAFGSGRLDDATAEAVVAHIKVCPPCRTQAASLSGDSFLARLQAVQGRRATPAPETIDYRMPTHAAPPHAPTAEPVPAELRDHPQYEVLRELGRGGMGVVYLAKNRLMGRLEVLKVVNRDLLDNPDAVARFLREIRSAASLNHPNIVTAYAALQIGNLLALAMEYIEGEDLARVVAARGPLPVTNACHYASQVAMGLQHAHEKGMVHRDIKPHNLILTRDGKKHIVKILDFGLAKAAQANAASLSVSGLNGKLTGLGMMMGTPAYVAPEQIRDAARADIRADLYSLGCTLYHLLAGHTPFAGWNMDDLLEAHLTQPARPVNEVRPEVPAELAAVVARLLAKEPGQRYQKPVEVGQALAPFCKAGLKPLPPQAIPAGGKGIGVPVAVTAAGSGTQAGGKQAMNPNSGQPAGGPAPVLRPTIIESAPRSPNNEQPAGIPAPVLRQTVIEPGPRLHANKDKRAPRSAGRKGARPWLIGGGFVLAVLLATAVGRWSAGVFEETPQQHTKALASEKNDGPAVPGKATPLPQNVKEAEATPPKEPTPRKGLLPRDPRVGTVIDLPLTASVKMKFAWVPAGESWFGGGDGKPGTQKFTLPQGLWCGVYEVTQSEWQAVMGNNPSHFEGNPRYPVESVSWNDVQRFIERLNQRTPKDGLVYRLPTSDEWEYICRGGPLSQDQSKYHFYFAWSKANLTPVPSNSLSSTQANFNGNSPAGTADKGPNLHRPCDVGLYSPNPLGIYDLHGNVLEWTSTSEDGSLQKIRGGGWCDGGGVCTASQGSSTDRGEVSSFVGFRLLAVPSGQ